jgi:hypothetical protein
MMHWLSFCDDELPKGSQFLGVCIVEAHNFVDAVRKAHALDINPGGEVRGVAFDGIEVPPEYIEKLLDKQQLEKLEEKLELIKKRRVCDRSSACRVADNLLRDDCAIYVDCECVPKHPALAPGK